MKVHIPRRRGKRPPPDDFDAVAPTMTLHDLRVRYHCGADAVRRWSRERNVSYKKRTPPKREKPYDTKDSRAVLDACLNCPYDAGRCRGHCGRVLIARAREMAEKGDRRQSRAAKRALWIFDRYLEGYEVTEIAAFCNMKDCRIRVLADGEPPPAVAGPLPSLESRRDEWNALIG